MNVDVREPDERPLLSAMRRQIQMTPMPEAHRPPRVLTVRSVARPRMLAGAATGAVAVTTAAVLAISAATTAPPAFAATSNPNGTVSITLNDITGVSGLNAKLASMGVAIRAVPVVSGCTATAQVVGADGSPQPAATLATSRLPNNPRTGSPATLNTITVDPPTTPGRTEILAASTSGVDLLGQTVQGQAPSCVAPGDSPPAAGTPAVGVGKSTIQLGAH